MSFMKESQKSHCHFCNDKMHVPIGYMSVPLNMGENETRTYEKLRITGGHLRRWATISAIFTGHFHPHVLMWLL